jgi:PAS domain S-box-containing protein
MKHFSFTLNDKVSYEKAYKKSRIKKYNSQLIQIFTSISSKKDIQKLLEKTAYDFPNAIIMGTTTAGEISHAKMHQNTTVFSISLFEHTKLKTKYTKIITQHSGKKISKSISYKNTKAAIILSEGLKGDDYEGFIQGIHENNPELIIAGGLAGDNFKLKNTYIFLNKKIYDKGSIAVSFSGKKIYAHNEYNLNWAPIGKEFTITSAKANQLFEIDNENAIKVFKRYFGKEIFKNNANNLPNIQLLFNEGSTVVSRTPMTINKKSIVLAAPIKEGQKVKFGFSNAASIMFGANNIKNKIAVKPAEAIYIFSCIARKTLLGKRLESEFSAFEQIAPTTGFFTYGEYYSTNVANALLNCTTTILVLSEKKKKKKPIKQTVVKNLENTTFQALTHFIKQTSKELDKNTELLHEYKTVVDEVSLVSKSDKNGIITYVNNNFCNISKYTKEELLGSNHNIVRDSKMPNHVFKTMWNKLHQGKVWKGVLSNKAKDGSIYYVDTTIMPIFNENKKIKEYIAIRQDITKQIQSNLRIKEKEQLIKAIFDNQDSLVILTSKSKGILKVNKKLFDYLDFKDFEDFKKYHNSVCELFIKEDGYINTYDYPNIFDYVSLNETKDNKVKMQIKDGTIHTFKIIVKPIRDEYIINLYDITNLENAILKAHLSEKAKSIFLANMSHEIRTPLNGIIGFANILTKKDLDDESQKYINIIHNNSKTLLNIVNDILDFSKIQEGKLSLYITECNLKKDIESTLATFISLAIQKNIDYKIDIDSKIPQNLLCDIQRIKQVVNNLVSNALKFTPLNGTVNVRIKLENINNNIAKVNFNISDTGIGISKDKIDTIFQSFSQADNSISKEYGGTGLGLAISNQYINLMHSEIEVQTQQNKGSSFYFTLEFPVIKDHNIPALPKNKIIKQYNGKVLLVEDNKTNQLLLSLLLKERNINYDIADNGQEALNKINTNNEYDIIFMDINMPILDGISATKILREQNYTKPIISLSANVIEEDIASFKKAGIDDALNKPIIINELDDILGKYMNKTESDTIFDTIDTKTVFQKMFIKDETMILSLLNTFSTSATNMLKELKELGLNKKLIHTIKGVSGNLRFENLYHLSIKIEKELKDMDEKKKQESEALLISHLTNLIHQVKELNK